MLVVVARTNDEWMVGHVGHDGALDVRVIDEAVLEHIDLAHALHGIDVARRLV